MPYAAESKWWVMLTIWIIWGTTVWVFGISLPWALVGGATLWWLYYFYALVKEGSGEMLLIHCGIAVGVLLIAAYLGVKSWIG